MSINLVFNPHVLNSPFTQGYISYLVDVLDIIDDDNIPISLNSTEFHKYTILFHQIAKPSFIRGYEPEYIVRVLHSGELEIPEVDFKFFPKEKLIYITQYKEQAEFLNQAGITCHYFPMGINTSRLPSTNTKNGKWIYFGNLYPKKLDTFNLLKETLDFDVLSFSKFNDEETVLSHNDCLNLVSNYSYGIGVGRCALEMVSMGLPVLVAGEKVGGTLVTKDDFTFHRDYNFNSSSSNSLGLNQDIETITNSTLEIETSDISLNLNNWISVLT